MFNQSLLAFLCGDVTVNKEFLSLFGIFVLIVAIVLLLGRFYSKIMQLPSSESQKKMTDSIVEELQKNRAELQQLTKEVEELKNLKK